MSSWMKRRINRSRVRCQKVSLANKEKMRRELRIEQMRKQTATTHRANYHAARDK